MRVLATNLLLHFLPSQTVTGGVETFSDVPIRYSRNVRKRLLQFPKASKKGLMGILGLAKGLTLKDLAPEAPAIANYTTGEVMVRTAFTCTCCAVTLDIVVFFPSQQQTAVCTHGICCYAIQQSVTRACELKLWLMPMTFVQYADFVLLYALLLSNRRATAATDWRPSSACPGRTKTSSL